MNALATIQNAIARKKMPPYSPGSMRDLANKLGLSFPVSLLDVMHALDNLLSASVTWDSGPLTANYVHASSQLFLQSDGGTSFTGQVHEAGAVGDNFILAIALLDVKDASGKTPVFVHTDTVAGQLNIGFSDKNWSDFGFSQTVKDNWAAVQSTRFHASLQVSTDPWQVTETVITGLFVGFLIGAGIAQVTNNCGDGGHWTCGWRPIGAPTNASLIPGDPNTSPGAGFEYV